MASGEKAGVALDDIVIFYGERFEEVAVNGYGDLNVGCTTNIRVENLSSDKEYYCRVAGIRGELRSAWSDEVRIRTVSSGLAVTRDNTPEIIIEGRAVSSYDGDEIEVYDFSGRLLAKTGERVILESGGCYMVKHVSSGATAKVIVRRIGGAGRNQY